MGIQSLRTQVSRVLGRKSSSSSTKEPMNLPPTVGEGMSADSMGAAHSPITPKNRIDYAALEAKAEEKV